MSIILDDGLTDLQLRAAPLQMLLADRNGALGEVSRFGQQIVGVRHDDVLCRFEYNISTHDVKTALTGSGAAIHQTSQAVASSGAGIGQCVITTMRGMTYRPAHEMYAYGSLVFGPSNAGALAEWGPYDDQDGYFFQLRGRSFLYQCAQRRRAG